MTATSVRYWRFTEVRLLEASMHALHGQMCTSSRRPLSLSRQLRLAFELCTRKILRATTVL
jgi:hypothetical protein